MRTHREGRHRSAATSVNVAAAAIALTLAVGTAVAPAQAAPPPTSLGTVAGQDFDYCRATTLPRNDDRSSAAVELPFPLTYYGDPYTELYVNNNGNVTFTKPWGKFEPKVLEGEQDVPIIAPFFADVDTRNPDSREVTYGFSPDRKTLCVNWADVGYYSTRADKLNTFQLLLTSQDGASGRSAGDFDITFNYDQITWETGSASGGSNGFGGTSAVAGFAAGLGDEGTYFQLDGSLEPGALLDSGPKALISRHQGSVQPGRFVFQVRNEGIDVSYGNVIGRVVDQRGDGVANAFVRLVRGFYSFWTETDARGYYSIANVRAGTYTASVSATGAYVSSTVSVTVPGGATVTAPDLVLRFPAGIPADEGITLTNGTFRVTETHTGIPNVHYQQPITVQVANQCAGASTSYTFSLGSSILARGSFTESPAGVYTVVIPPVYPNSGSAQFTYTIQCPDGTSKTVSFDIYIDPSGQIVDQYGTPVAGATATVLRAETSEGPFEPVTDLRLLGEANRSNPIVTTADGRFYWDVVPGWYQVKVEVAGAATIVTAAMEVAPARTGLVIVVPDVPGAVPPAPSVAPAVTGTAVVGQTVSVTNGTWPDGITVDSVSWFAGTTLLAKGAAVTVPASAVGANLTATITAHRDIVGNKDGIAEADGGELTTFTFPFERSVPVGVVRAVGLEDLTTAPLPAIAGTAKVGQTLVAQPGTWLAGTVLEYGWYAGSALIAGATTDHLTLTAKQLGKAISVKVTGRLGQSVRTEASAATGLVKAGTLAKKPVPKITGKAVVGKTLKAKAGTWDSGVKKTYRWYAGSVKIKGATKAKYKVAAKYKGKKISVKVTGKKAGYTTAVKASKKTAKVKAAASDSKNSLSPDVTVGKVRAAGN